MRIVTEEKARNLMCIRRSSIDGRKNCIGSHCFSWLEINPRIEREDHSGGKQMMQAASSKRGFQKIKRTGPVGSLGILILEAQGTCGEIHGKGGE